MTQLNSTLIGMAFLFAGAGFDQCLASAQTFGPFLTPVQIERYRKAKWCRETVIQLEADPKHSIRDRQLLLGIQLNIGDISAAASNARNCCCTVGNWNTGNMGFRNEAFLAEVNQLTDDWFKNICLTAYNQKLSKDIIGAWIDEFGARRTYWNLGPEIERTENPLIRSSLIHKYAEAFFAFSSGS